MRDTRGGTAGKLCAFKAVAAAADPTILASSSTAEFGVPLSGARSAISGESVPLSGPICKGPLRDAPNSGFLCGFLLDSKADPSALRDNSGVADADDEFVPRSCPDIV